MSGAGARPPLHPKGAERPPLAADYILGLPPSQGEVSWSKRDTVIYNMGIGFGASAAADPAQLPFVLEEAPAAFPTMVCVFNAKAPGLWHDPATNIDFAGILHGEEAIEWFAPLAAEGTALVTATVEALWDKGADRGAVLVIRRDLIDPASRAPIARIRSTLMLRGNGGYGGPREGAPRPLAIPNRAPDGHLTAPTRPEQALLYRLSGDRNPLHSDPATAARAGYPRPILMGLCSLAVAARALVAGLSPGNASALAAMRARFTGVVYPGETLTIDHWRLDDQEIAFRARIAERDAVVIDGGRARLRCSND